MVKKIPTNGSPSPRTKLGQAIATLVFRSHKDGIVLDTLFKDTRTLQKSLRNEGMDLKDFRNLVLELANKNKLRLKITVHPALTEPTFEKESEELPIAE
jgi:hypothetical protein